MSKKAPCKCKAAECEECPEWIFTFADLVMLMMGFFVILWVLKPNPGKQGAAAAQELPTEVLAGIREAFGYVPDPNSTNPVDMHMINKVGRMRPPQGPGDGGKTMNERKGIEGTDPEVTMIRLGKQSTVGGRLLFEPGNATLSKETESALEQIAAEIRGHRNLVLVKGHTSLDDLPASASTDEKMNLSLKRAQAAAAYLQKVGVEPEVLRVQGCSTFEPVRERAYHDDTRAMNRRVEVNSMSTLVEELQDKRTQTSAPAAAPSTPHAPAGASHAPAHSH